MKGLRIGNLAIAVPIIQGGMGVGISLSGLAAAVANEGGAGLSRVQDSAFYIRNFHLIFSKPVYTDLRKRFVKHEKRL